MYKNILLSIDLNGEASWSASVDTAIAMCRSFGAALHLVHVIADVPEAVVNLYLSEDATERLVAQFSEKLNTFVDEHIPKEIDAVAHLCQGNIYSAVLEMAKKVGADLVIIGSHDPTMGDFLLGPNADRVVRHAECSVLVVRS